MGLPSRGSFLETLLTSLVLTAAALCWINLLLDDGVLAVVGIVVVALVVWWVWLQRLRPDAPSERPFLIGGAAALVLGIAFQIASK